jgi:hypothetical protein
MSAPAWGGVTTSLGLAGAGELTEVKVPGKARSGTVV